MGLFENIGKVFNFLRPAQTKVNAAFDLKYLGDEAAYYERDVPARRQYSTVNPTFHNRLKMLNDDFFNEVKDELYNQFIKKNADRMRQMISTELNLFSWVVKKVSRCYTYNPQRSADITTGDKITHDKVYDEVISKSNINLLMSKFERIVEATNQALLKVVYKPNGIIEYQPITMDVAEVKVNGIDSFEIEAVKYRVNDELWCIYDKKEATIKYVNKKDEVIRIDELPYKDLDGNTVLPFILWSADYPLYSLLNRTRGETAYSTTIQLNVILTYINYLIKMQSYKQPYISGEKVGKIDDSAWDAASIQIYESAKGFGAPNVGLLDLQVDIDKLWQIVKDRATYLAAQYGITGDNFNGTRQAQSGYAIKLSNRELDEYLEQQKRMYAFFENQTFEVTRIVWNFHDKKKISNEAVFKIDYIDPQYEDSITESIDAHIAKIRHNIETPADWIMEDNPDVRTVDEALEKFQQNKAVNEQYKLDLSSMMNVQQDTNEDRQEDSEIQE